MAGWHLIRCHPYLLIIVEAHLIWTTGGDDEIRSAVGDDGSTHNVYCVGAAHTGVPM